jgi:hypothetical protein
MKSYRIRTEVGKDKYLNIQLNQEYEYLDILSLKLLQEDLYQNFCSDYGVLVGRVFCNGGFGVPNAKLSVFIPYDESDGDKFIGLYPYEIVTQLNQDGLRYNLFTDRQEKDCISKIGSFPSKRKVLDNNIVQEVFDKYYKFTIKTNQSGDYMFFGLPVGLNNIHVDVDISDIGILSQKPYDIYEQNSINYRVESPQQFITNNDINLLPQVRTVNTSEYIKPLWGNLSQCEIGINRLDIDLGLNITPSAVFMGSIFTDSNKRSVNKDSRPRARQGFVDQLETRSGTIEIIRKTNNNSSVEQISINGGKLINDNGVWCFSIPMNQSPVVTDEFGNVVPSLDINKGIYTKGRFRFRIGLDFDFEGARLRQSAKFLVPNNPKNVAGLTISDIDKLYGFDENTPDEYFATFEWNKIYSVKNFIARYQKNKNANNRNFIGLKQFVDRNNDDDSDDNDTESNVLSPPYNRLRTRNLGPLILIPGVGVVITAILALVRPKNYWDFYNDWLNGSLYAFQFKLKVNKDGDKLYSKYIPSTVTSSSGVGSITNQATNPTVNSYIKEITPNNTDENVPHGLILENKNIFYYPSNTRSNGNNINRTLMFATDIICLGSLVENNIDANSNYFIEDIPPTTFNNIFSYSNYNPDGNNNIRRVCELGVGVEQRDSSITLIPSGSCGQTDSINDCDFNTLYIRDLFALENNTPNVDLNDPVNANRHMTYNYVGSPYEPFRNINNSSNLKQPLGNSLYFYFGIKPGQTAIDEFRKKYIGECSQREKLF